MVAPDKALRECPRLSIGKGTSWNPELLRLGRQIRGSRETRRLEFARQRATQGKNSGLLQRVPSPSTQQNAERTHVRKLLKPGKTHLTTRRGTVPELNRARNRAHDSWQIK